VSQTWADVPADVLAHYVPAVLAPDGRYARIRELLTTVDYLDQKLLRVGMRELLEDEAALDRLVAGLDREARDAQPG